MPQIRIISGSLKGRKIRVPEGIDGLRPTKDMVRETLFNWLGQNLEGWQCFDAFAGSGALGFEALSRGAVSVLAVEQNAKAFATLKKTAQQFKLENKLSLHQQDVFQFLDSFVGQKKFDISFVDPPFARNYQARILAKIASRFVSRYIFCEYPLDEKNSIFTPDSYSIERQKVFGQTLVLLFSKPLTDS